ncbi:HhH-GPD family protein [Galactobacter valiniphilus]|nr:A/G-specific adenine glycosylase [Galactobacter valiniphilus]
MSPQASALRRSIISWFQENGRDLPWRRPECSPWGVLVSEVMLQQTPVVRVLPVWESWMERWPTPEDLAAEPAGEAVRAWEKLGYPRRALRLHACARELVEVHGGEVPADLEELLALPGVGEYTAAAVASFAFGVPAAVVDTNVRRVEARAWTGNALPEPSYTRAEARLAHELMPDTSTPEGIAEANAWNAASMELGALICTARSPRCDECPVQASCAWIAAGRPAPHYTPKGQAWEGTDRQVRGAMMAVLRAADGAVPAAALRTPGDPAEAGSAPQDAGLEPDAVPTLRALRRLAAGAEQRERCLAGLLADGLAVADGEGVALPA